MQYRSVTDLYNLILKNLNLIPEDIDLIVGVPRSGMLPGTMISLALNIPLTDLDSYIRGDRFACGTSRKADQFFENHPHKSKHVLVVDDSIATGNSMQRVKHRLHEAGRIKTTKTTFAAIFTATKSTDLCDIQFECVKGPRIFDWNILHTHLGDACVDIDGVLCIDPTPEQDDDGPRYREFLKNANPLIKPRMTIGYLVTSRLEKYRQQTEEWLARNKISFNELHMLDLPDKGTRLQLGLNADFKAQIYKQRHGASFFLESEDHQARKIALLSGKMAYGVRSGRMFHPEKDFKKFQATALNFGYRVKRKIKDVIFDGRG